MAELASAARHRLEAIFVPAGTGAPGGALARVP
jgi:hypothetical protein